LSHLLGRQNQEEDLSQEYKASLGNRWRSCFKNEERKGKEEGVKELKEEEEEEEVLPSFFWVSPSQARASTPTSFHTSQEPRVHAWASST
jgi:hypothetical protein